jgi:ribosomal protein S18 acetylase RimI-like enzyme
VTGSPDGTHPLDNPVWSSLRGGHAGFAERRGRALRYPPDVVPFAALPNDPAPDDWADLAALAGPGGTLALAAERSGPPSGWQGLWTGEGVQLVDAGVAGAEPGPEVVELGSDDVPEMLDLTDRTKPGPFLPRTYELGRYLGIRRDGALVAMAGERLKPPGWTEISAVCTDGAWRGHGFASQLIRALVTTIRDRGDRPFLHAVATNTNAIRLYEAMGFEFRRPIVFRALQAPEQLVASFGD